MIGPTPPNHNMTWIGAWGEYLGGHIDREQKLHDKDLHRNSKPVLISGGMRRESFPLFKVRSSIRIISGLLAWADPYCPLSSLILSGEVVSGIGRLSV